MHNRYSDSKPYDASNLEDEFLCEYVDGTMDPLVPQCVRGICARQSGHGGTYRAPKAHASASVSLCLSLPGAERSARSAAQFHPRRHVPPQYFFPCRFRGHGKGNRGIVLCHDGNINAGACSGGIRSAIREQSNACFRHDGIPLRAGRPIPPLCRRNDAAIFILVCDSPPAPFSAPPPRTIHRNRRH